jgi:hypothetical protein
MFKKHETGTAFDNRLRFKRLDFASQERLCALPSVANKTQRM